MSGIGPGGASTSTAPPRAGGDDKIATATAKHKATRRHDNLPGKAKELLEEQAAKAAATNRWKQRAKHSD
jgi:hypothetical protein